jgi:hypothetical protein
MRASENRQSASIAGDRSCVGMIELILMVFNQVGSTMAVMAFHDAKTFGSLKMTEVLAD